jgi:hypothetical protein
LKQDIYGYPIQIQALALRCARQILELEGDGQELIEIIDKWITAYSSPVQSATMEKEPSKASGSSKNASPKYNVQSPIFQIDSEPEILNPKPISSISEIDLFFMGIQAPDQPK